MNATKHTPGPWKIIDTTRCNGYEIFRIGVGNNVGGSWAESITSGDRDANARLIAAAPDLLESLRFVCSACRAHDEDATVAFARALAAIAKATGSATPDRGDRETPFQREVRVGSHDRLVETIQRAHDYLVDGFVDSAIRELREEIQSIASERTREAIGAQDSRDGQAKRLDCGETGDRR